MLFRPTSDKAAEFQWFARKCHDLGGSGKRVILYEGWTVICAWDTAQATIIALPPDTGIIFHPRSGGIENLPYTEYVSGQFGSYPETKYVLGIKGGWKDGKTLLETEYIYPLVDADNASFLVTNDGEEAGAFVREEGNYGNLYWDNGAVWDVETQEFDKDYVALSWRGTPTRHFRLPSNIYIQGFSTFETSTPGQIEDTPQYTAFGTTLYQYGAILAQAPKYSWPYNPSGVDGRCLILGACLNEEESVIYIVTQSDHYNAPASAKLGEEDHPLTKGGFWLTLWKEGNQIDGWDLIFEQQYIRNGLPWFGNIIGTEFVCSNGDTLTISGQLSIKDNVSGTYTVSTNPVGGVISACNNIQFNATFNDEVFFEYGKEQISKGFASLLFNSDSTKTYTETRFTVLRGTYPLLYDPDGDDVPTKLTGIIGSTTPVVSTQYSPLGGQGPYTWGGDADSTGLVVLTGKCGTGTVTVTDSCGDSASISLKYPTGVFRLVYEWRSANPLNKCGSVVKMTDTGYLVEYRTSTDVFDTGEIFYYKCFTGGSCRTFESYRTHAPSSIYEYPVPGIINYVNRIIPADYCPSSCGGQPQQLTALPTFHAKCSIQIYEWRCSNTILINGPTTTPAPGTSNSYTWVDP